MRPYAVVRSGPVPRRPDAWDDLGDALAHERSRRCTYRPPGDAVLLAELRF